MAVALCCAIACGDDQEQAPVGRSTRGVFPTQQAQPAQAAPIAAPTAAQPRPVEAPPVIAPAKPVEEQAPEEKPKRDYSAELLAAVGTPAACLKARSSADAPAEISVSLETHVVDTGAVTRGYASSSRLDDEELLCIRKLLSGLRFQAPVDEAPRTVTATLRLQLKAPDKADNAAPQAPTTPPTMAPGY